ncbi:hypothetical protein P8936_04355 [Edaphobacter paludis]|uniref:Uncharacterized protein n=1 Tax=Edaphobacter paludis TaxID=3035702 RepID=A0AAU7D1G5_9BACT
MQSLRLRSVASVSALLLLCFSPGADAQTSTLVPGLSRIAGTDPASGIAYARLLLEGKLLSSAEEQPKPRPTLTAQCTQQPNGKLFFELFANYGGVEDTAFHRPWQPSDGGVFAPTTVKVKITMEFLGYTHVKPVTRQWEKLDAPAGQFRYNPPSGASSNMEDSTFYLQYLKALPTLRLTYAGKSAEFLTTPLLDQVRKEPLCKASHL